MRAGWEIVKLDEVISFERGLTYAKGDEVAFSSVGVLRSNNVDLTTQSLNLDEIKYLREDFEVPSKKKVRKSSLLMCMSNGSKDHLGKVALIDRELDYAFGGFMGLLTPDEGKVFPKYLYYALASKSFKDYIHSLADGANINNLKYKDLAAFDILLPSLAEQQRIVDILDQEFAKIDALKANAEKSLQAAKDLFLQMLAHTFANPSWSWKRIGDVFDTGAGGTPLKTYQEYYENGDIPWLRSGEVCKKYITEMEMFITQLGMDNSSAKMFPENTVVVAMYGATAGQVGILHLATTTNQAVCGIFPKEDYVPEFIYYSLLNSKKGLVAQATGNAQPNISQIKIKNTLVPVISRKEQEEVVSNLDDLNAKCQFLQDNYQKTLALCDDLKQSLLRKAFNGEL